MPAGENMESGGAPANPGEACSVCHRHPSGEGLAWGVVQGQRGVKAVESGGGTRCPEPRVSGLALGQHVGPSEGRRLPTSQTAG